MATRSSKTARLVRSCSCAGLACLFIGVLVIAIGLILPSQIEKRLTAGVLETIVWTPKSPPSVDARYRNNTAAGSPADYFKVWLFNITNLEQVRNGSKPKLSQVGPYVHRVYHEKHDVLWSADGQVHFKDYTYFVLDTQLTSADVNAPIATFNMALLGVLAALHGNVSPRLVPFADLLMQIIARYQEEDMHGLFVVKNATQLLWGYEDKLLELLQKVLPAGSLPNGATVSLLQNTTSLAAALAKGANVFNTGELDISQLWNMEADHGHTEMHSWPCPEKVRGTDATQFRPGLTTDSRLTVFVGDVYQAADLVVNSTVDLHGVKLLRFWMDPAQAEPNPCHNQNVKGLINITTPQAAGWDGPANATGPAVFVSMPMFCGADEWLQQQVEGVQCDWENHITWVDAEPTTGITMRAYKRMMISSQIGSLGGVVEPLVAGNLTIPMLWVEETGQASEEVTQQFKSSVYRAQWLIANISRVCWIAGGCFFLCGTILAVLTIHLASEPDKWPGATSEDAVLAEARRLLNAGDDEQHASYGSAVSGEPGKSDMEQSGVCSSQNQVDTARQRLLEHTEQGSSAAAAAATIGAHGTQA